MLSPASQNSRRNSRLTGCISSAGQSEPVRYFKPTTKCRHGRSGVAIHHPPWLQAPKWQRLSQIAPSVPLDHLICFKASLACLKIVSSDKTLCTAVTTNGDCVLEIVLYLDWLSSNGNTKWLHKTCASGDFRICQLYGNPISFQLLRNKRASRILHFMSHPTGNVGSDF